ncbi:MAG: hypothetical protein HC882_00290 [Acidobacteria bacterium]|nr:hypothetical protein [Acidobacteriota bacterium]
MAAMKNPMRGWDRQKPKKITERRKMPKVCFLDPKGLKYPVCPKSTRGKAKPTCKGVLAAFSRARQQHNQVVAKKAVKLADVLGCGWVKTGSAASEMASKMGLGDCGCSG